MNTELDRYDPARADRLARTRVEASPAMRADALEYWQRSPYRMPQHLTLFDDVVEGELLEEIELAGPIREDPYLIGTVVDDPRTRPRALGPDVEAGAEDPSMPEDVAGPEHEEPAGVRVAWKRPTELIADAGAKATGRGMDLCAELAERLTGRHHPDSTDLEQDPDPTTGRRDPYLAPVDPFRNHDYRAQTPAPPETISR